MGWNVAKVDSTKTKSVFRLERHENRVKIGAGEGYFIHRIHKNLRKCV